MVGHDPGHAGMEAVLIGQQEDVVQQGRSYSLLTVVGIDINRVFNGCRITGASSIGRQAGKSAYLSFDHGNYRWVDARMLRHPKALFSL